MWPAPAPVEPPSIQEPQSSYSADQPPTAQGEVLKQTMPSVLYIRREWYVGLTDQFVKDIASVDRKLQGQILIAISQIADNPTYAKGDTVKPLTGPMKGLWRYRIGDNRLVYKPQSENNHITLIAFASRGDIYD